MLKSNNYKSFCHCKGKVYISAFFAGIPNSLYNWFIYGLYGLIDFK